MSISNILNPDTQKSDWANLYLNSVNANSISSSGAASEFTGGNLNISRSSNDATASKLTLLKSRSSENAAVQNSDYVSNIYSFAASANGTDIAVSQDAVRVNGTVGNASVPVDRAFIVNDTAGNLSTRLTMASNTDFVIGLNNKLTTDTSGFVFIPSVAGAQTGVPGVARSGYAGLVFDHTNLKLYAWVPSLSAWKSVQFA